MKRSLLLAALLAFGLAACDKPAPPPPPPPPAKAPEAPPPPPPPPAAPLRRRRTRPDAPGAPGAAGSTMKKDDAAAAPGATLKPSAGDEEGRQEQEVVSHAVEKAGPRAGFFSLSGISGRRSAADENHQNRGADRARARRRAARRRTDAEPGAMRDLVTLRVGTDDGIEGIGYTFFGAALTGALQARRSTRSATLTIGEDPLRTEAIAAKLRAAAAGLRARAASSRSRCPRSTSRCGTSRARRSTCRCGRWSAATASACRPTRAAR